MENINSLDVPYIMGKILLHLGQIFCFRNDVRYRTPSTISNGITSQDATDFVHSPVETLSFNKEKATVGYYFFY